MDLEALPPEPVDPVEPDGTWTPPRRVWSVRARVGASIGAVGVAGAAAFGVGQMASSGGVHFAALAAAASPSSTAAPKAHGGAFGTVSNLSGPNFTVTATRNGSTRTTNVVTDATTKFTKTVKGAVGDIKVGDRLAAKGTRGADGSLAATQIYIAGPDAPATAKPGKPPEANDPNEGTEKTPPTTTPSQRPPFAQGTVQSIAGGVITVTSPRGGTDKITTAGNPTVVKTVTAALADVTNGATVAVQGTPSSDGTHLTAARVDIVDPTLGGPGGPGGFGGFGKGGPDGPGGFGHRGHGGGGPGRMRPAD